MHYSVISPLLLLIGLLTVADFLISLIFVSKIPNHIHSTISNLNYLSSDHTPIYLEVGAWATKQIKPSLTSGRVNWSKLKKLVTDNINLKPSL